MNDAFEIAIAQYPGYYALYDIALSTLEPRWGGNVARMYRFVDQHAGQAPEFSPLKFLYLTLYRDLLSSASVACRDYWRDKDKMSQCAASFMGKNITTDLEQQVQVALQLYDHTDKHQFNVAIKDILNDMLKTSGGDVYSGAILQLSATAMRSNTQLVADNSNQSNYIIDIAVGDSWYQKGFYDNALTKYQRALQAVEVAPFPSEEEKYLAVSLIYDHLARAYERLHQYVDMIVYERAAIALGGKTGNEHYVCYGYYNLRFYDEAVRTCTEALDNAGNAGNLPARYWRAMAYRDLGDLDTALRDFTTVADSDQNFRIDAAIEEAHPAVPG